MKDEVLTPGEIHSLGDFSKDAPGNETPSPINTNAPSTPLVTPPTPTSRKAVSTLLQLVDQVIDSQDEEEAKQFIDKSHEGTSATNAEIVYKSMLARHAATLRFISVLIFLFSGVLVTFFAIVQIIMLRILIGK